MRSGTSAAVAAWRTVGSFSFLTHFNSVARGVVELPDLVFFVSFIMFWLFANAVTIELKKAQ